MIGFEWEEDYDLGEPESPQVQSVGESVRTVLSDGTVQYINSKGQLHRLDGPAVELANGTKEWWVCGVRRKDLEGED